jgi:hypothetical protein
MIADHLSVIMGLYTYNKLLTYGNIIFQIIYVTTYI